MRDRLFSLPSLLDALGDAAIVVDRAGKIVYANGAVTALLGFAVDELVGAPLDRLLPERYRDLHARQVEEFRARGVQRQMGPRPVLVALAKDGGERPVTISIANFDIDRERYSIALLRDATRLRDHLEQVIEKSETDALTGMPNRLPLMRKMQELIAAGRPFGLLFLDLSQFKPFNDRYGHRVGDDVLRTVGSRLKASVRHGDLAVRWAGDEFVLLLDGLTDGEALAKRAESVAARIGAPFRLADRSASVEANIGGALFPRCGQTVDALIDAADRAMYIAKKTGRRYVAEPCVTATGAA